MSITRTGAHTIFAYKFEDENDFNQDPSTSLNDSVFKPFGANEDISDPEVSNNSEPIRRPFNRQPVGHLETGMDGSWGCDFTMTNGYWLQTVFGKPAETNDSSTEFTFEVGSERVPRSVRLLEETHYPDGTVTHSIYTGCAVTGTDAEVSVDDVVSISLDGEFADVRTYDSVSDSPLDELGSQPSLQFRPLHFGNAELELSIGGNTVTRQGAVQDASISFNAEAEMQSEIGSRVSQLVSRLAFDPEITYTKLQTGGNRQEERKNVYGGSAAGSGIGIGESLADADIEGRLKFDSPVDNNNLILKFAEAFPESYTPTNIGDVESALEDDLSRQLVDFRAIYTTDESDGSANRPDPDSGGGGGTA